MEKYSNNIKAILDIPGVTVAKMYSKRLNRLVEHIVRNYNKYGLLFSQHQHYNVLSLNHVRTGNMITIIKRGNGWSIGDWYSNKEYYVDDTMRDIEKILNNINKNDVRSKCDFFLFITHENSLGESKHYYIHAINNGYELCEASIYFSLHFINICSDLESLRKFIISL